jgi:calcineurin-like phosphoesterase family protein
VDCAKTAAQFLLAEMKGDQATADHLAGILKFAPCNVEGWAECVTTYLQYKNSGGTFPYRPGVDSVHALGDRKSIAIIGDWGTGESDAINLLRQVQKLNPDVLIHLGDVYFAGTQPEQKSNFVDVCKRVLGNDVLVFSLCGNHDMYSGGEGYYWMLDQIGQKASYFCLQNDDWQFLALDTGHNDSNPATIAGNMTSLMEGEGNWHLAYINRDKAPRTVLLSHHQLFSPFGAVGTEGSDAYAFNPHLYDVFKGVIPQIVWWFWGHEHTLAVFDEYMGLKRGRCLGASAVPVYFNEQSYQNASGLETLNHGPLPTWNGNAVLAVKDTLYGHAFAIMTLDGRSANVDYYQVFGSGNAVRLDVTDKA